MALIGELEERQRAAFDEVELPTVELSAVTSNPHEHVVLNWQVKNFKKLVDRALDKDEHTVATLPFSLVILIFKTKVQTPCSIELI